MSKLLHGTRSDFGTSETAQGVEHTVVGQNTIGGPLSGKDVRMYLTRANLRMLLEMAEASPILRVQLDGVGLKVTARRMPDGHVYEVWTIISAPPKPETPAMLKGLL